MVDSDIRSIDPNAPKSKEYGEGYEAYRAWSLDGSQPRPVNPYPADETPDAIRARGDWQDGWDDASFDF